jgi:hypothetical protein
MRNDFKHRITDAEGIQCVVKLGQEYEKEEKHKQALVNEVQKDSKKTSAWLRFALFKPKPLAPSLDIESTKEINNKSSNKPS